jgi:hypothetical protein
VGLAINHEQFRKRSSQGASVTVISTTFKKIG